jgi:hypothetical protein
VTTQETNRPRVHIACIRLQPPMVFNRLTHHETRSYAASLTTGDDWTLLLRFSDKEEVPGSSPGSPTPRSPVNAGDSGFSETAGHARERGSGSVVEASCYGAHDPSAWMCGRSSSPRMRRRSPYPLPSIHEKRIKKMEMWIEPPWGSKDSRPGRGLDGRAPAGSNASLTAEMDLTSGRVGSGLKDEPNRPDEARNIRLRGDGGSDLGTAAEIP